MRRSCIPLLAALGSMPTRAVAQESGRAIVRVRVVDSARSAVEGADVSLVRGLSEAVARGITDRAGQRTLSAATGDAALQVVVRKVGFERASRFVDLRISDTVRVEIVLARLTRQLDTVRVTAEQSAKRARTFIDAEAIADSRRPLFDAFDVINKLRPNMTLEPPDLTGRCRAAENIWVNGNRIVFPPVNSMAEARKAHAGKKTLLGSFSIDVLSVLATIKPEHIESIEYHDCMDQSVERARASSALFVLLKDGVQFKPGIGSYVLSATAQDSILKSITRKPPAVEVHRAGPPSYRSRILGIFDADSGTPLDSVAITDVATGTRTYTSSSGTVSLVFMQDGAGRLAFSKAGYRPDTLPVRIVPSDTLPITAVLVRLKAP